MSVGQLIICLIGKPPPAPPNGKEALEAAFRRFHAVHDQQEKVTIQLIETTVLAKVESATAHELAMARLECECPLEEDEEHRKKKDSSIAEIQL